MSRSCRGPLDKRKQKPQSTKRQTPQDKRQRNHAREEDEHPRRAAAPQAPTDNHQKKEKQPSTQTPIAVTSIKEPLPTIAPRGKKTQHKGQDHQNSKTKGTPGGAEAGRSPKTLKTDSNHNQRQKPTAVDKSAKRNAHRKDQTARRKPRAIKCSSAANAALSLLHRCRRGDGGCSSRTNP